MLEDCFKEVLRFQHRFLIFPHLYNMRLSIFILSVAALLLISCTPWIRFTKSRDAMEILSQKALFNYLQTPDPYMTDVVGKGPSKIDQVLRTRDSLIVYGRVYFDDPMYSDQLIMPLQTQSYQLTIPDSLANRYALTLDTSDYELDYALIYQFSPLLPTKDPQIYFMEFHKWFNKCGDDRCVRILYRGYLRFSVKGKEVVFLEAYGNNENKNNIIGFGGFERKEMEEALPGEKIFKYNRW